MLSLRTRVLRSMKTNSKNVKEMNILQTGNEAENQTCVPVLKDVAKQIEEAVRISPDHQLRFNKNNRSSSILIENNSAERLAFKLKTSNPIYKSGFHCGIIEPHGKVETSLKLEDGCICENGDQLLLILTFPQQHVFENNVGDNFPDEFSPDCYCRMFWCLWVEDANTFERNRKLLKETLNSQLLKISEMESKVMEKRNLSRRLAMGLSFVDYLLQSIGISAIVGTTLYGCFELYQYLFS